MTATTQELQTEITALLPQLPPEQLAETLNFIHYLLYRQMSPPAQPLRRPRIPGLHRGIVTFMADDFDAPLPDSFWFPSDDPLTEEKP